MAFGRLMYLGSPDGVVPWFSDRLGFPYLPAADGLPCDWVMDMVSPDVLAKKVMYDMLTQSNKRIGTQGKRCKTYREREGFRDRTRSNLLLATRAQCLKLARRSMELLAYKDWGPHCSCRKFATNIHLHVVGKSDGEIVLRTC